MCGIVGAVAERNVTDILLEGLKRLEYRGYDSAGLALIPALESGADNNIELVKAVGKVNELVSTAKKQKSKGRLGIAHTRWATHGKPTLANAHPHTSSNDIAVAHNGIIENYEPLREKLIAKGYKFKTQTDTETIVHLIHQARKGGKVSLLDATKQCTNFVPPESSGLSLVSRRARFLGRRPWVAPRICIPPWAGGILGRRPYRSQLCRRACTVLGSAPFGLCVRA